MGGRQSYLKSDAHLNERAPEHFLHMCFPLVGVPEAGDTDREAGEVGVLSCGVYGHGCGMLSSGIGPGMFATC